MGGSYYTFPRSILSTGNDHKTPAMSILMFQQINGETLIRSMDSFKDTTKKSPHHGIDLWDPSHIFYDHANPVTRRTMINRWWLSKFEADFKRQQGEMTNKIDTVLKAITDQIAGTLPSDMVRNLNSMLESLGLVPRSANAKFVCSKKDDGEVMFIEIIRDDDEPRKEGPNEGEVATTEEPAVEYYDTFPTRDELTYHRYLLSGPIPLIFLRNPIITEGCPSNLKIPCNIGHVHIEKAYIDLNSPLNIMTRMMYNWIMRRKLNLRENPNGGVKNFTGRIKGMHVFVGNFTYVVDFMIVEDISSIIDQRILASISRSFLLKFPPITHDATQFAQILNIPCEGACVFTDKWSLEALAYGVSTDGPYQPNPPSPDYIISYIRINREGQVHRISHEQGIDVHYHQILTREIVPTLNPLQEIIQENSPELSNESYVLYDHVMNPLTTQQERKTRNDRGTRRGHHSTSSSSAFDQPSSSHLNDDDDGNDEGTSRASIMSPISFEVILNGNKVLKRKVGETEQEYEPTIVEEKHDRRNEMKARGTLLMALPNKDQLKFHSYKDAKLLMEAIEKRYGGNKESKKVQRTLLKQQYENFAGSSSETMDQTFDRSLPSEWKTHALIWRNKVEIETISLDDLYNNLKIYETKITGLSSTSQNPQNVAFVSYNSNSSTNEADNTAYGVSASHTQSNPTYGDNLSDAVICAFLASYPNSPQMLREDLEQIYPDGLEEMDLQWEMAMLTIRAMRFIKRTGRQLDVNGQRVGFDRSKVECYNCHKYGHFAREYRLPRNQEKREKENNKRTVTVETPNENALVAQDRIGGYDWSYQAKEEHPTNFALMAHTSLGSSSSSDSEVDSCSKLCVKAYATLKEQFDNLNSEYNNQVIDKFKTGLGYNAASSTALFLARKLVNSTLKMLENQEYNKSKSDKGYHAVPPPYTGNFIPFKPDLTFMDEIVESENMDVTTILEPKTGIEELLRPPVIEIKNSDDDSDSFEHLHYVCDKKVIRAVWNNSIRVNHKNFANKMTHPHPNRKFVPQAVLTRASKINNAGASVNTAVRQDRAVVSENKENRVNVVKASACWGNPQQKEYKEKGVIDSGCSRHMTGNKCYLTEYEDYDGGFVSFGDGKGRIFGKVLSSDFKLLDESQVLLRVPRKDNIYSVDLKSVVPTKEIENQLDHKVKVIRCDNGIEFKNSVMNQFCEMKGIKREFSVARTPQQNGVTERRNRTLIEAARTMLVDSKLPTTFWTEAVNTACYVLNRYSVVSKAMGVFNKRTRIVEETLNIRFLKNTPNVTGIGSDWLFDVDSLTISMNYVPVVTGNQTNDPKVSEEDAKEKTTEINESGASDKDRNDDQAIRSDAAGPSFTNDDPSSPVNAAEAFNAFEEHLFERFSPFKNAFTHPPVSNVTPMDDTGIFGNAYDDEDVGAEADLNNLETTLNVSPIPTTRINKDHPKDQIIGDFNSAIQTRRMTKITDEH
ncbi:ribonuclease H-like domain-containing protein, partial [Tanacetum coccineum]